MDILNKLYQGKSRSLFYSFITTLLIPFYIFSAGPHADVYYAEKWMQHVDGYNGTDRNFFVLGAIFPHIHYLDEVKKELIQTGSPTLQEVYAAQDPFQKGVLLHLYVNRVRASLVAEWNVYSYLEAYAEGHKEYLLKVIEEEIMYNKIDSSAAKNYLSVVSSGEIQTGVSSKSIQDWHFYLGYYFSKRPSEWLGLISAWNFWGQPILTIKAKTVKMWSQILPTLAQKPEMIDYVDKLTATLESDFQTLAP